ncbi:MucBP domain-containing protein [Leucobacter chromiireducens]|uniref:LPXTG cell wall anchor domain-containing protein n=1 Tax=Leucobacter chromiireducens subsp. solipictus TaxID=398235 RepID=A0ABS1SD55_9MICO|nr:MucBP domain-containing protein [Leucobacter chromiireducens]MBL3678478.1 LPXTG cell wall anchor domain-containing protein [Leucobacter chromiireducens subsp. solipictus]
MGTSRTGVALLAAALSGGLLLGGGPAQAAPLTAAACIVTDENARTQDFYSAPILGEGYAEGFPDHLDTYQEEFVPYYTQEMKLAFSGTASVPPNMLHYLDVAVPAAVDTYRTAADSFLAASMNGQRVDASGLQHLLSADYDLKLALFNGFVAAYTADQVATILPPEGPEFSQLVNALTSLTWQTPSVGTYSSYQQLGYSDLADLSLDAIYAELFTEYTSTGLAEPEARARVFDAMRASTLEWIERVDLDYLRGYQAQVRQYLSTAQAMGIVVRTADNTAMLPAAGVETRPLQLSDLDQWILNSFSVDGTFLALNLTPDGTDFLSPEDVFASDGFQALVEQATWSLENIPDHDPGSVTEAVEQTIRTQYGMLATPGSSMQPIMAALAQFIPEYLSLYANAADGPALAALPNWKGDAVVPGELPYDTYRAENYRVVPHMLFARQGHHTVTREIVYTFEDGSAAADTVTQEAVFTCQVNAITGETTWVPEGQTDTLPAVPHPTVTHPAAHATVLPPEDAVLPEQVTPESADITRAVVFPLEFRVTVRYVNEHGAPVPEDTALVGRWNTAYSAEAAAIDGYTVSSAPVISGVFGVGAATHVFTYAAADTGTVTPPPTVTPPTTPPPAPQPPGPTPLAQTGAGDAGLLVTLAGGAVLAGAGLLLGRRRAAATRIPGSAPGGTPPAG